MIIRCIFISFKIKHKPLFIITLISMFLYIPVNRYIAGGYTLKAPIDDMIPLIPVFVIPYLFGLIFWFLTIVYLNIKKKGKEVRIFNVSIISASVISILIYILIPTFVDRPLITYTDIFSNILNWIYMNDRPYNAAPSGHTFYTLLCFLSLWKIYPKHRFFFLILSVLIIASTLFTKQHNFMDMILGSLFALMIYIFSVRIYDGK